MAGLTLKPANILQVLTTLYPLFIVSLLLLVSVFNGTILKGLVYLSGIVLLWLICVFIGSWFFNKNDTFKRSDIGNITCDFIFTSFNKYTKPRFDVALTFFTFIYLVTPMFFIPNNFNVWVFSLLFIFSVVHMHNDVTKNVCTSWSGARWGLAIGSIFAGIWFALFWHSSNKHLLFYNELLSNKVVCNKPSDQKFKCSVYRNGEIISNSVLGRGSASKFMANNS